MRIYRWIKHLFSPSLPPSKDLCQADAVIQELEQVSSLIRQVRESRASGNPVRDMVVGQYHPSQRGANQ